MCNAFTRYIEELNKHMLPMLHLIQPAVPWDKVLLGNKRSRNIQMEDLIQNTGANGVTMLLQSAGFRKKPQKHSAQHEGY